EVGVLVLAIDANRSGGKGHGPVLARLDLNEAAHLAFLAQILSGEEIRFTADERRAWVLVWLAFWAIRRDDANLDSVLLFPANHPVLNQAWQAVYTALEEGESSLAALRDLVLPALTALERPSATRDILDPLGPTETNGPAARTSWSRFHTVEDIDSVAARLLVTPLLGDFLSRGEEESALAALPRRVKLFHRPEPGQL
ncbi:MAG TPA: hypothetical protein DD490_10830, partial [Acidobacteria bacterium]|nr:hypothetical protein [Acidobacteriota bacterium]